MAELHALSRIALAATLSLACQAAFADLTEGRRKAQMCAACHGPWGQATMPNTPHLAAQPAPYLAEQLKAYRSGKRNHDVMTLIAKPLTDAEIADLADWYASLQIEVKPAP